MRPGVEILQLKPRGTRGASCSIPDMDFEIRTPAGVLERTEG